MGGVVSKTRCAHFGYEHAYTTPQFGIVNMNGRLYDPLMGRIYSPDDYVQTPYSTQGYNRYSYCQNNPLKYTDANGELFGWDDLVAFTAGGLYNLYANRDHVHNFWQGLSYFGAGGVGADLTYNLGPVGAVAGGALNMAADKANGDLGRKSNFQDFSQSFLKGALSSFSGAAAGYEFDQAVDGYTPWTKSGENFEKFINATDDKSHFLYRDGGKNIFGHSLGFYLYQGGLNALNGYATNQYNFTDQQDIYGLNVLFSFAGGAVASAVTDIIPGLNNSHDPISNHTLAPAFRLMGTIGKSFINSDLSSFISGFGNTGNVFYNTVPNLFPISTNLSNTNGNFNFNNAAATMGDDEVGAILGIFNP